MELTNLLAQSFGLYFIIAGLAIFVRQTYYISVVANLVDEKFSRLMLGILELLGGAFLVFGHWEWSSFLTGLITLIGVLMVAEGTFYLFASNKTVDQVLAVCNKPSWYRWGGLITVILGFYMLLSGSGLM